MTTVRILPKNEWPRLFSIGPFAQAQVLPDPLYANVLVEENEAGEIVGCWEATSIILLEGLWRREDQRKSFSAKRLLFGMIEFLRDRRVKTAITVVQNAEVRALAEKAGFVHLPGTLHLLTLKDLE